MPDIYRERRVITYERPIQERVEVPGIGDAPGHRVLRTVARLRLQCEIEVIAYIDSAARLMGPRACENKGGVCVDGELSVKRVGVPREISRQAVGS